MFMEIGVKSRRYRNSLLLVGIGALRLTERGDGRLREGDCQKSPYTLGDLRTMVMG